MLCTVFDENALILEHQKIATAEANPQVFLDPAKTKMLGRRRREIENLITQINDEKSDIAYFGELLKDFLPEELDFIGGVSEEMLQLKQKVDNLYIQTLYSGPHDNADCLLEIHSGAGGEEAQDWAEMLMRMYLRYGNIMGYETKIVDSLAGDGAGIKSAS
jgi:peptide chain release factor 2